MTKPHKYLENPDKVHRFTVISPNARNGASGYPRRWTTLAGAEARMTEILLAAGPNHNPTLVIVEAKALIAKKPPEPRTLLIRTPIGQIKEVK